MVSTRSAVDFGGVLRIRTARNHSLRTTPARDVNVGVFIMSHRQTETARRLARAFRPLAPTWLVDLGSPALKGEDELDFNRILPNLYYVGALEEGIRWFSAAQDDDVLLVITGDVEVENPRDLLRRLRASMIDRRVGVYAPACAIGRRSMRHRAGAGVVRSPFVEGYCFASRLQLLRALPLDTRVNRCGWGVDVYLGYLTLCNRQRTVVDHDTLVHHPDATGYSRDDARQQRDAWFSTAPLPARLFRFVSSLPFGHHPLFAWFLVRLPWWRIGRTPANRGWKDDSSPSSGVPPTMCDPLTRDEDAADA